MRQSTIGRKSEKIEKFASEDDSVSSEENFDKSPYLEALMDNLGGGKYLTKVNPFTLSEYDYIWDICSDKFMSEWFSGKGRNLKITPRNELFMVICICFSLAKWEVLGVYFGIGSASTTERFIHKAIDIVVPILKIFIPHGVKMNSLIINNIIFQHFPQSHYATDATVQQRNKPYGTFE